MRLSLKTNLSSKEYGLTHEGYSSPKSDRLSTNTKKVNIQSYKAFDDSKNNSILSSPKRSKQNAENNLQLFFDKNGNEKNDSINESVGSKQSLHLGQSSGNKHDQLMSLIQNSTHYKIGMNEHVEQNIKQSQRGSIQLMEQEQDLDGWLKKQQSLKAQNVIFQEEEEQKKEIKHKLLDDILAKDTPELNQKIISSILRDKPGQQLIGSTQSQGGSLQSSIRKLTTWKKLKSIKNENRLMFDSIDGKKDTPLHITAATSSNLLRIYNPFIKLENQETLKRQKTEGIINKIIIDKVKQEEKRLMEITQNQLDLSSFKVDMNSKKQNNGRQLTEAELAEEENQKMTKLIDVGKQKAKNTLKNFKGLQNFYMEKILLNDNIKRKLDENQKTPKMNIFNFKGENMNTPYSEIENIYLPKYFGTFQKLEQTRVDEYELRIQIANLVEIIKSKQLEITELQLQLDCVMNQPVTVSNQSQKNTSLTNIQTPTVKSNSRNILNNQEFVKINKRKEGIREQINTISNNVNSLKQDLQVLDNKMMSFQDNIKQLKIVRTKIRTYIKTTLLHMMQKDLMLFINPKKPIDLSLPHIIAILIKIGENVYNENFPQFLDASQKDTVLAIAHLMVQKERINEKDLKEVNSIKLPANPSSILSQLNFQCSKQCITQEAEKRIKELTKEIVSVKKPIFKLDEDTHTHTMQYENVIQHQYSSKKINKSKLEIEEKKDAVLNRLNIREAVTKCLSQTTEKIKELEEKELDRLEKSYSSIKNDQIPFLRNILVSIFGVIRGCEQLQYMLQFHKFRKQLLVGNNYTTQEKMDLVDNFRNKKYSLADLIYEKELRKPTQDQTNKNNETQGENSKVEESIGEKYRNRSETTQKKQDLKYYQSKNKDVLNKINQFEYGFGQNQPLFNTFIKSIEQYNESMKSKHSMYQTLNQSKNSATDSPRLGHQIYQKDIILQQSTQPRLLSERGQLTGSQQMIYFVEKEPASKYRISIEHIKLNKIVQFENSPTTVVNTPMSLFARKTSINIYNSSQSVNSYKLITDPS